MNLDNTIQQNEFDYQKLIIAELNEKKAVKSIAFRPYSPQFVIPDVWQYNEIIVRLNDVKCKYKRLVFSSLYTICYEAFLSDTLAVSLKNECRTVIPPFIDYLNSLIISETDRVNLLKDYERHRVVYDGVKTQSTNVGRLINLIRQSLNYEPFTKELDTSEFNYLNALTKTKVAPSDEVEQYTLTKWFSFHSWLRREDIGIGNDMFTRLASPKALTTSFRITTEVSLIQIQKAKHALIEFFQAHNITTQQLFLPELAPKKNEMTEEDYKLKKQEWNRYIHPFITARFEFLQKKYFAISEPSESLKFAYEVIMHSWCHEDSIRSTLELFLMNKNITRNYSRRQRFIVSDTWLFSHEFLRDLAKYAHGDKSSTVPTCNIEHLLFQWLMAYQSVQTADIPKLRLSNFRFIRRRGGQITHIESEYFKGRANDTCYLKSITANSDIGKGILTYFNDRSKNLENKDEAITIDIKGSALTTLKKGNLAKLIRLCSSSSLRTVINTTLQKNSSSPIFIEALNAIVEQGICYWTYYNNVPKDQKEKLTREDWLLNCDSCSNKRMFGLSSIKNSCIHARSDSFNPTQLQNYNSHSNETERKDYRTKDNFEWSNNCGRITRAVMQDMHINVFSPSKSEIQSFNSEFTRAADIIDMRKENVISRLKLITGKNNGRIDELGFLNEMKTLPGDLPDTLYLMDSPETVMRFYHYIHEVEIKHKQLGDSAKEYLLFTVLPTVEWMSLLLTERRFSRESFNKGKELFDKYLKILPSNFSALLGGE